MANIEVRGYVSKPTQKSGGKGPFSTFTLSEKIKDPKAPNGSRRAFYSVTDFNNEQPPEEGSYVVVKGWLKPREYEQNGNKRLSNDIICQGLEVVPPREGGKLAASPGDNKDTWEF